MSSHSQKSWHPKLGHETAGIVGIVCMLTPSITSKTTCLILYGINSIFAENVQEMIRCNEPLFLSLRPRGWHPITFQRFYERQQGPSAIERSVIRQQILYRVW